MLSGARDDDCCSKSNSSVDIVVIRVILHEPRSRRHPRTRKPAYRVLVDVSVRTIETRTNNTVWAENRHGSLYKSTQTTVVFSESHTILKATVLKNNIFFLYIILYKISKQRVHVQCVYSENTRATLIRLCSLVWWFGPTFKCKINY